jgi:uncharacterized protein (TIGR01619 family)
MANDWKFYRLLVDNEPASMFVNLGIGRAAPVRRYEHMAYLRLRMLKPREDGLSSQEEFDELCRIEDAATEIITRDSNSVYVGRNTSGGNRDFYFYTDHMERFQAAVAKAMARFQEYSFQAGGRADPEWRTYFDFLHPSPEQMEQIKNRDVLDALRKHGDELTEPREIDHFAYFADLADCQAFVVVVRAQGFVVEPGPAPSGSAKYGVKFSKVGRPVEIDDVTIGLSKAAGALRGTYDGWGCPVVGMSAAQDADVPKPP